MRICNNQMPLHHHITFQNTHRDEDGLDIDAIIEANKEALPKLPDPSTVGPLKSKMKGLKGPPADDEEARKGKLAEGR